jgi:hypothetical protein
VDRTSLAFRSARRGLFAALVVGLGVLASSCGRDGPTEPSTRAVTVTVNSVTVIGDCEGVGGNHGDFALRLVVIDPSADPQERVMFAGTFPGISGNRANLPDIAFTMQRAPRTGDAFTLQFHVTEWDGSNVADPRMNDEVAQAVHAWTGGADWANGPHVLVIDGGPGCGVGFRYSVAAN